MKCLYPNPLDWAKQKNTLGSYITHCKSVIDTEDYTAPEASLCLPSDKKLLSQVMEMVGRKKTPELKYVIVIGIGGSNLGAKAIYDALYGSVDQYFSDRYPRMIFLDTIDPKANKAILRFMDENIKN